MHGLVGIEIAVVDRVLRRTAVILGTGGGGRMFPFTTNGTIKTGDGMALAYRAGVPLKDMEFIQYHQPAFPLPEF